MANKAISSEVKDIIVKGIKLGWGVPIIAKELRRHKLPVPSRTSMDRIALKVTGKTTRTKPKHDPELSPRNYDTYYDEAWPEKIRQAARKISPYDKVLVTRTNKDGSTEEYKKREAARWPNLNLFCRTELGTSMRHLTFVLDGHPELKDAMDEYDERVMDVFITNGALGLYNSYFCTFFMANKWGWRTKADTTTNGQPIANPYADMDEASRMKLIEEKMKLLQAKK